MFRYAQNYLKAWLDSKIRKPLIIRGARQVGKSTLVRKFAASQNLELLEVNLEQHASPEIWRSMQTNIIQKEIELATGKRFTKNSLLFIDEIQNCPLALQALRYFYEELPSLPVIAAGSLLEFTLSNASFPMPVGRVSYYHLGPMTFREVLVARGYDIIEESLRSPEGISPNSPVHDKLKELYLEFLFVGGMPQAVSATIEEKSVLVAREIHRSIMATYQNDFSKYSAKLTNEILERVFRYIPLHLGEKIKYVNVSKDISSTNIKQAVDALIKARILLPAWHCGCTGIPIRATRNENIFKLYFLDVGLALYESKTSWLELKEQATPLLNKGNIAEQFVAQHLAYIENGMEPPELNYWLREGKSTNAEVDFVISKGGHPYPIEIKAGATGTLRSLFQFASHTNCPQALRLDMSPPSVQQISTTIQTTNGSKSVQLNLESQPVYMVENLLN